MTQRSVRISEAAYQKLKRVAEREERTMRVVVERLVSAIPEGSDTLSGIPAIIGTHEDFPVTHRSEYLGISREPAPAPTTTPAARSGSAVPKRSKPPVVASPELTRALDRLVPKAPATPLSDEVVENTAISVPVAADPWGAPCGRCHHAKRLHEHKGVMSRCSFAAGCPCRSFLPVTDEDVF